jgi:DNA-binding transcriptional ArsR family regulator/uncharacterized protein YndB with AHSA1/START domain
MSADGDPWRALASPWRRQLLDLLGAGPHTTGELADEMPGLSRYAVMQHLAVLERAGLVVVRRRGRHRFNHLNPVPLRRWYERWVVPLADAGAGQLLALERAIGETGGKPMATMDSTVDEVRTVRIESELRFAAPAARVFAILSGDSLTWFPHSYGGGRTQRVVLEPRVGGNHYEDWGNGAGYLYGHVTEWDPPRLLALRTRLMDGTLMDTRYEIEDGDGGSVLRMGRVIVGPLSDDDISGIHRFGDLANFADGLRALIEA